MSSLQDLKDKGYLVRNSECGARWFFIPKVPIFRIHKYLYPFSRKILPKNRTTLSAKPDMISENSDNFSGKTDKLSGKPVESIDNI